MRKFILILLSSVVATFLSGCYDYIEPNDLSYVVAIGVDKGKQDNLYNYTLQFAKPTQISGGSSEEGGSGKETLGTVKVEAPSIYSALNVANHVISKSFTLSHTKIIVISEELAKEGIERIVDAAGRSTDLRPTVFFCVSAGEAEKYLESVKPVVEINPVKYYRLIFESPNSSYIPKNDAGNVFFNLRSNTEQCTLPYVGVGKGSSDKGSSDDSSSKSENQAQSPVPSSEQNSDIPINEKGFEYHMKEYVAGKLDIEKQNASEVLGTAVFKGDKMIGTLSGIESEMLNILLGRFTNGYSTLYVPETPQTPVTIRIEQESKPKINLKLENGKPKINIKIKLLGNFMSVPTDYIIENNLEEFEKNTSEYIEEFALALLEKTKTKFNSDIIGFGKNAKKKFLTNKEFEEFDWNEAYTDSEFSCEAEFSIRRTGLTMRQSKE